MKKLKKYLFLIFITVCGGFLLYHTVSFGRYVSDSVWNYYLKSKGFYFSSNYLETDLVQNVNNLWDGDSIHFDIKNNLNQTVITTYDINYNVVCTIEGTAASYTECHLNGTSFNTQSGVLSTNQICVNNTTDQVDVTLFNKTDCELGGYTWENQVAIKDLYFDVVLTDEEYSITDVIVNVTVTSTSPYSKTISGNFILHKNDAEEKVTISYENYSTYDRLIVSNSYLGNKCVKIAWDSEDLLINANNSEFFSYETDTNGYINEIDFIIGAKTSLSYIFYSTDFNLVHSVSDFSIIETSSCQ